MACSLGNGSDRVGHRKFYLGVYLRFVGGEAGGSAGYLTSGAAERSDGYALILQANMYLNSGLA